MDNKIYATLIRIQAKIRGIIVREKVRGVNTGNKKFMPYHDPEAPFKVATNQRIVILIFFKIFIFKKNFFKNFKNFSFFRQMTI
jgi:hypothetical protein